MCGEKEKEKLWCKLHHKLFIKKIITTSEIRKCEMNAKIGRMMTMRALWEDSVAACVPRGKKSGRIQ